MPRKKISTADRSLALRAVVLVLVIALGVLAACGPRGGGSNAAIYNMREVTLAQEDKDALVDLSYRLLSGTGSEKETPVTPALSEAGASGVFLSFAVPKSRAWVSFGMGNSIVQATTEAAGLLAEKAGADAPWRKGVLKVDVVAGTEGEKTLSLEEKVGWDRTLTGAIFDLAPVVALLPEEMAGWNVVSDKGLFQKNNLSQYLAFQKRGKILADLAKEKRPVKYATFHTISFGVVGGERVDFYRGRRVITSVTPETLLAAAKDGAQQLARFIDADGRFHYVYRPELDRDEKGYNDLRHCGSVFSMLEAYEVSPDPQVLAAAKRAIDYMMKRLSGPAPKDAAADWLAIKGKGKADHGVAVDEAKLGGAGLALLMLAKYQQVTGDTRYLERANKIAKFVEFQQKPSGEFASKYYYGETDEVFESLYYPGEAMYGMLRLYKLTGDRHLVDVVAKGLDFIALVRDKDRTPADVEPDHWMMYALSEAYPLIPKPHYIMHIKKIGEGIRMDVHGADAKFPDYVGGFFKSVGSTPAATRNEGLIAGYRLLAERKDPVAEAWLTTIRAVAAFQLRCQLADESAMYLRNPAKAYGGFKKSLKEFEMRNDYTQHNVSALLGLARILSPKEAQ